MILKTFSNIKSKIRTEMAEEVREKYTNMNDLGVDGVISALNDFRDHVLVLFTDCMEIVGAASYYLSKKSYIEIDHIGVIDRHKGYGKLLMTTIFKLAKKQNRYPVSLVSNGFSNEFYEKIGMIRINNAAPTIYEMQKEQLDYY
jgi:hypothetical protein